MAVVRHACDRCQGDAPIQHVLQEVKALERASVACEVGHDPAEAHTRRVAGWTFPAYYDQPEPPQDGVHVAGHGRALLDRGGVNVGLAERWSGSHYGPSLLPTSAGSDMPEVAARLVTLGTLGRQLA